MENNDNLFVTIASFINMGEAELAKSLLDAFGVWCSIDNKNISSINPLANIAFGGIRLIVRREDAELAKEFLNKKQTYTE